VKRSSYVLRVGGIQRLHHLDAKASTVSEEHANWGMALRSGTVMLGDRGAAFS